MTIIAGLLHGGKVYMGGDSAGTSGWALQRRKDAKVFARGPFLIGYTTSFRLGQLLRFHLQVPQQRAGQDDYEYMVTAFVPAARQCFKDHGYTVVSNNREEAGTFLVGYHGRLFTVESDFQVAETMAPFAACGCGSDLALGSLHASQRTKTPPRKRMEMALQAAEDFSAGVRGPFVVLAST